MNRKQKLMQKRETLRQQVSAVNRQIATIEQDEKRKEQAALIAKLKSTGLLDKSPEELERIIAAAANNQNQGA